MFMQFKWDQGKIEYRVTSYDFSVSSEGGETALSNCQPGAISLTLELPAEPQPGKEFFAFAAEQHDTASEKGKGTITVFKGEKTTSESLQQITFSNGWITKLELNVGDHDEKFRLTCNIAATNVSISETDFEHHRRAEHFM
jgi:hypothetical protein